MKNVFIYRRVRTKRPWAGNLRMQRKRGVGAKCVFVRKRQVVSAHHPERHKSLSNHTFYYNIIPSRWAKLITKAQWVIFFSCKIWSLVCFNWSTHTQYLVFRLHFAVFCMLQHLFEYIYFHTWLNTVLPLILASHHGFATCLSGRILRARTYPLQEVDAKDGGGR